MQSGWGAGRLERSFRSVDDGGERVLFAVVLVVAGVESDVPFLSGCRAGVVRVKGVGEGAVETRLGQWYEKCPTSPHFEHGLWGTPTPPVHNP